MSKKKVLVFDVETTGLPEKGQKWREDFKTFPRIVQFSWEFDGEMYDYIIKPDGYLIPNEATAIHGIDTEQAEKEGVPFSFVVDKFLSMALSADVLVAHNMYFDSSIIKANALRLGMEFFSQLMDEALDPKKRVCTMMKTIKFVGAKFSNGRKGNKFPSLIELYDKLFEGEKFAAHNSAEDVKATSKCYHKLIELEILENE